MEKKNNGWGIVVAVVALIAALTAAVVLLVRSERQMQTLLGMVEEYLPRRQKNAKFEVEL